VKILTIVPTLDTGVETASARARVMIQPAGNTGVGPESARYRDTPQFSLTGRRTTSRSQGQRGGQALV